MVLPFAGRASPDSDSPHAGIARGRLGERVKPGGSRAAVGGRPEIARTHARFTTTSSAVVGDYHVGILRERHREQAGAARTETPRNDRPARPTGGSLPQHPWSVKARRRAARVAKKGPQTARAPLRRLAAAAARAGFDSTNSTPHAHVLVRSATTCPT